MPSPRRPRALPRARRASGAAVPPSPAPASACAHVHPPIPGATTGVTTGATTGAVTEVPGDASGGLPNEAQSAAATRVMQVLPRVMDAMRLAMRAQLDGPLTVPQFRGLNFVDRHPGSSVSALAGFLGVTLATASAMADRLVRAGYLQSQDSSSDRRRTELTLQANGKAVLERMRRRTRDDLARNLRSRSPQELATLVDGLAVLDSAFPRSDAPPLASS